MLFALIPQSVQARLAPEKSRANWMTRQQLAHRTGGGVEKELQRGQKGQQRAIPAPLLCCCRPHVFPRWQSYNKAVSHMQPAKPSLPTPELKEITTMRFTAIAIFFLGCATSAWAGSSVGPGDLRTH